MQSYRRQVVHPRGKLSSQVDSAHSVMLRRVVVLQAFRWPSVPLQVPRCSFSSADVSSPPSAAPAAASLSLQDLQKQRSPLYKPVRGQTPLLPHLPLTAAVRCRCRPTISYCTAGSMALCGLLAAHWQDPLEHLQWQSATFHWLTAAVRRLAKELCGGRLLLLLEGG